MCTDVHELPIGWHLPLQMLNMLLSPHGLPLLPPLSTLRGTHSFPLVGCLHLQYQGQLLSSGHACLLLAK